MLFIVVLGTCIWMHVACNLLPPIWKAALCNNTWLGVCSLIWEKGIRVLWRHKRLLSRAAYFSKHFFASAEPVEDYGYWEEHADNLIYFMTSAKNMMFCSPRERHFSGLYAEYCRWTAPRGWRPSTLKEKTWQHMVGFSRAAQILHIQHRCEVTKYFVVVLKLIFHSSILEYFFLWHFFY